MYTPGLDLIRLISLYSPLPESIPSLLQVIGTTTGTAKEVETNSMLALRALTNVFIPAAGKSLVKEEVTEVRCTIQAFAVQSFTLPLCILADCRHLVEERSQWSQQERQGRSRDNPSQVSTYCCTALYAYTDLDTILQLFCAGRLQKSRG